MLARLNIGSCNADDLTVLYHIRSIGNKHTRKLMRIRNILLNNDRLRRFISPDCDLLALGKIRKRRNGIVLIVKKDKCLFRFIFHSLSSLFIDLL